MEHKITLSQYLHKASPQMPNTDYIYILKDMIRDSIIENGVYYDFDDIEVAVEIMYPIIFNIVFNINLNFGKDDKEIDNLITYLVTHIA